MTTTSEDQEHLDVVRQRGNQRLFHDVKVSTLVQKDLVMEELGHVHVVDVLLEQLVALARPRMNANHGHSPSFQTATQSRLPQP